jgi:hypothetical protein
MNKEQLFKFYEKLYFHEIESREKISSRLQLPLAIIIGQIGLIGYILKQFKIYNNFIIIVCMVLFGITILFLGFALKHFIKSWYNYEYSFLPTASDTEKYRSTLINTYNDYEDRDKLVENALKDFIYKYYIDCSTINTVNNDTRSFHFHRTASNLIISFALSIVTLGTLFFSHINNNINNSTNQVHIINKTNENNTVVKGQSSKLMKGVEQMSEKQKPPEPPPPPPKRLVREGVEIKPPKQKPPKDKK